MLQGKVHQIALADGTKSIAVASTGNIKTQGLLIERAEFFGIWMKATSASGTADVKVEMEQCYKDSATALDWVVPDSASDIITSMGDELVHVASFSPVPMSWLRLSVTGVASNPADTIFEGYIFLQSHA